jgi:nitrous oxidase accessory protein NosD
MRPGTLLPACGVALALVAGACSGTEASSPRAQEPEPPPVAAASGCDRYASPRGSDFNRGTRRFPYRSVPKLTRSLRAGEAGCLIRGVYRHRGVARLRAPGTTLRPLGRQRAVINGAVWVLGGARGARIMGLHLTSSDRVYAIPLKVQADDVTVTRNTITGKRNTICVLVGSDRTAERTLIEANRISDCGRRGKLDHLLYISHTRDAVVRRNLLTDNPGGYAVHLYPDADGTVIEQNVMDANLGGVVFAGDGYGDVSEGNEVRENVIVGTGPRWNVEGSWSGGPVGDGNFAHHNCVYTTGPSAPSGLSPESGFAESDNLVLPRSPYRGVRSGDYTLRRTSPCWDLTGLQPGRVPLSPR